MRLWQNWIFERKHAEDLQRLRGFRLLDDDFMSKVFEDKACSQFLLQIILEKNDLSVQKVHAQHDVKNLQGRSIRLDIIAIDGNGRVYNIEIQRSDKGASIKRARYNSSLLDANVTEPGDETHILYVNSQIKDETELGKLMHDFSCTDAKDMHYKILADRVRYFKEDAKGVEAMCRAMEDMRKEAAAEQNILTLLETLRNLMKNLGWTAEQAMTAMGVSDSEKGILIKRI